MDTKYYNRLTAAADLEHRLNLEAIERVRRMEQSLAESPVPPESNGDDQSKKIRVRARTSGAGNGKVLRTIRDTIGEMDGNFSRVDIERQIKLSHPSMAVKSGSLKAALNRLVEGGELEVVVKAQGRRAAVYKHGQKPLLGEQKD